MWVQNFLPALLLIIFKLTVVSGAPWRTILSIKDPKGDTVPLTGEGREAELCPSRAQVEFSQSWPELDNEALNPFK